MYSFHHTHLSFRSRRLRSTTIHHDIETEEDDEGDVNIMRKNDHPDSDSSDKSWAEEKLDQDDEDDGSWADERSDQDDEDDESCADEEESDQDDADDLAARKPRRKVQLLPSLPLSRFLHAHTYVHHEWLFLVVFILTVHILRNTLSVIMRTNSLHRSTHCTLFSHLQHSGRRHQQQQKDNTGYATQWRAEQCEWAFQTRSIYHDTPT
jgi:hypothetical protein